MKLGQKLAIVNNGAKNSYCDKSDSKQVFGTYEWASHNANFISGCQHDCKYCYSKEMAIRFHKKTPGNWHIEEVRTHSLTKKFKRVDGTIMFPSSHDIHPEHLKECLLFLGNILASGNQVLVVTKPHLECIQAICEKFGQFKNNILFRFTIGSADSSNLEFWEPGAPSFPERIEALKWAFHSGFNTSISCEPMLDDTIEDVIRITSPFVTDCIWIGKANFLLRRLKLNGAGDSVTLEKASELLADQSEENILGLFSKFSDNPKVKWKESIKKIVDINIPTQKGLDI